MKTRVLLFVFVLWISLCFTSVSAVASGPIKVSDKLIERINHKNKCYAKTPLKIRLTLISMPSQHSEQVQKVKNNQVLILLMDKNLRIKVGSKMQKILSVSKCNAI
ncbi:MAG: TPM domain-containing protein, partial [Lactobacillus iners]|nr:TPM domain-containing protein [Lactobacillus iners]MCT7707222.1 TPM domain-containing protein [Lactobacillus iners]